MAGQGTGIKVELTPSKELKKLLDDTWRNTPKFSSDPNYRPRDSRGRFVPLNKLRDFVEKAFPSWTSQEGYRGAAANRRKQFERQFGTMNLLRGLPGRGAGMTPASWLAYRDSKGVGQTSGNAGTAPQKPTKGLVQQLIGIWRQGGAGGGRGSGGGGGAGKFFGRLKGFGQMGGVAGGLGVAGAGLSAGWDIFQKSWKGVLKARDLINEVFVGTKILSNVRRTLSGQDEEATMRMAASLEQRVQMASIHGGIKNVIGGRPWAGRAPGGFPDPIVEKSGMASPYGGANMPLDFIRSGGMGVFLRRNTKGLGKGDDNMDFSGMSAAIRGRGHIAPEAFTVGPGSAEFINRSLQVRRGRAVLHVDQSDEAKAQREGIEKYWSDKFTANKVAS